MSVHRTWLRRGLLACLILLAAQQLWRHGHDYVLTREFAVVEPGRIYRGGWQKDWPMRRIIRDYHIKSLLALAHPEDHPLSVQERELASELGIRWIHIPIVDLRSTEDPRTLGDLLDAAADALADPANQPIFFHCHHGLNRASMAQIAYPHPTLWLDPGTGHRGSGPHGRTRQGDARSGLPTHGRLLQQPSSTATRTGKSAHGRQCRRGFQNGLRDARGSLREAMIDGSRASP